MLFICAVCQYGHKATEVEQFMNPSTGRYIYLCNAHNDSKQANLIHIPWISDTISDRSEFCVSRENIQAHVYECIHNYNK